MEGAVEELRAALRAEEIPLELLPGGEIALDRLDRVGDEERRRFSLAGSGAYLLVEFPYYGWPLGLEETLFGVAAAGLTPVLAHPERSAEIQGAPERLEPAVRAGTLIQVTAASLDGRLGRTSRRCALELVERGLAHLIASDAHAPSIRGVGMSAAAEAVGDRALARWLTVEVPRAIVAGEDLPRRPSARRRWRP
jgi:protein-tyrosine phosphatase